MGTSKEKLGKLKRYAANLHIDAERQRRVYDEIKDNAEDDFDFSLLTISAAVMIILGLIVDSSSVILGGVLISPLVWPVLALSLGLVEGKSRLIQSSTDTIVRSAIIIFLLAFFIGLILPDYAVTGGEFLSRTSPTIFELLIAITAGFTGAFIVAYPGIGSAIAGVFIASTLMTPLSIMGIALSHWELGLAMGAFLLYLSNLIAITFASSFFFTLAKFKGPASVRGQEKRKNNLMWTVLSLVTIAIPLLFLTEGTVKERDREIIVKETIAAELADAAILDINMRENGRTLTVGMTIEYPGKLDEAKIGEIEKTLSDKLEKTVVSRIAVIPIVRYWEINN